MFTKADLAAAHRFVKSARAAANEMINPYSVNTIGDYAKWFPSHRTVLPLQKKLPGFLPSLGKTVLGAGLYPLDMFRSAVGLGPGRSMLRNQLEGSLGWWAGKATGDDQMVQDAYKQLGSKAWTEPFRRSREQSHGLLTSMGDYMSQVHPYHTEMLVDPSSFFRRMFSSGPVEY